MKKDFNIINLVSSDGCFDLQFRKDTRHERTNAPTYYRLKAQFVVTSPKNDIKLLEKIKNELDCGDITVSGTQARFSVQKINDIADIVVPYFRKNCLVDKKKKDFELWAKGVDVMQRNRGKQLTTWKKGDICTLIEVHKSASKYKIRPRTPKWIERAKTMTKTA